MITGRKGAFRSAESAKRRRKQAAWKTGLLVAAFFGVLIAAVAALWLPYISVRSIEITGAGAVQEGVLQEVVAQELQGAYALVFPRRSIFLVSRADIERALLAAFPRLESAEVSIDGFSEIAIRVTERDPTALWCGEVFVEESSVCYVMDETGYIFDRAPTFSGTILVRYFGAVHGEPIGAQYLPAREFRTAQSLVRALAESEYVEPVGLSLYGDEDFRVHLARGGSIIFTKGAEVARLIDGVQTVLSSEAFKQANLANLEYIDLRFGNKVYYRFLQGEAESVHREIESDAIGETVPQ